MRRCRLLGLRHRFTEICKRRPAECVADLREELGFFFLHVVPHVLHQHGDLGVEALVAGVHPVELGEQPLHDVVLLEALESDVLSPGHGGPRNRVEQLLLDRGMNREFLDDAVDDLALLDESTITGFLESAEELLDAVVVVLEKGDRIHVGWATPCSAVSITNRRYGAGMAATNRLAAETSPYLRQHAENPVDWYAWGPQAFSAAEERNVPILLSVGYSACHWCHVMAHECFEDDEVAAEMNRRFVNIKVDREERPDVDAIYMDAVQAMSGRGGWPMTVFLTPDGHPFFGGTYYPKPNFLSLMAAIDDVWISRPDDVRQNVEALGNAIRRTAHVEPTTDLPGIPELNQALQQLAASFDPEWGGFGGAPKFPSTMSLDLVLRAYQRAPQDDAKTIVTTSLDAMASGGMYDHIGGGFYATPSIGSGWYRTSRRCCTTRRCWSACISTPTRCSERRIGCRLSTRRSVTRSRVAPSIRRLLVR